MTFSGGGFRATFAALGAIRFAADCGLLSSLRYVSSVSGGSIANALLAHHWAELRARDFTAAAVDDLLIEPAILRVSHASLKRALIANAWRMLGPRTRTDVLGDLLDAWFLGKASMEGLDPEVRWIINAANIMTGARFTFERDVVGDYVCGLAPMFGTGIRLAQAAAASAAVPGAFAAWKVRGVAFPCATRTPMLLDGGVYDNTGTEAIDSESYRNVFLIVMNAGGLLRPGAYGRIPLTRDLARANSLLYRQSTALRTRQLVDRFKAGQRGTPGSPLAEGARSGVLVQLSTSFPDAHASPLTNWRQRFPELRTWAGNDLALVKTSFDRFPEGLCRNLIYRAWWLVGAAMTIYHPTRAPAPAQLQSPKYEAN
jgi:NTE family protein